MFLHNVLGRKIYPTLLRPRSFIHNSFSIISSRPEGLPKSPRPRLFKPEWASNILQQSLILEKKTLLHMVRRAHSSCAPNNIALQILPSLLPGPLLGHPKPLSCQFCNRSISFPVTCHFIKIKSCIINKSI
jgi:hypothetical protein